MKNALIILIASAACFTSCDKNKQNREVSNPVTYNPNSGSVQNRKTTRDISVPVNKRIEWKFTLPNGYSELSTSEVDQLNQKGREVIEELAGQSTDDGNRTVFAAKKDEQNIILVTRGPYDAKVNGLGVMYMNEIENATMETYRARGIPFNFKRSSVKIDDLNFRRLDITIFGDEAKTHPLLFQTYFSAIMEDKLLVITNSYNDRYNGLLAEKKITGSVFR